MIDNYQAVLADNEIKSIKISRKQSDNRNMDGIRLATMHRVKGLEFQYVFIVASNDGIVPLANVVESADKITADENMTAEKCLLYVALTRAQKMAYITGYGKMSVLFE